MTGLKRHDDGKGSPNHAKKGKESHPYDGICCAACWNAKKPRCTCKCGGKHHGKGTITKNTKKLTPSPKRASILTFIPVTKSQTSTTERALDTSRGIEKELDRQSIRDIAAVLQENHKNEPHTLDYFEKITPVICCFCGGCLGKIEHRDHDGGWIVEGFTRRQWLWRTCGRCGQQVAIWKLGVQRGACGK